MADEFPEATGVVAEWKTRGFGFITPDDGGRDLFFHSKDVEDPAVRREGARVVYSQATTGKGPQAVRVRVYPGLPVPASIPASVTSQPPAEGESDLLTEAEFRAELDQVFGRAVAEAVQLARRHNWVE